MFTFYVNIDKKNRVVIDKFRFCLYYKDIMSDKGKKAKDFTLLKLLLSLWFGVFLYAGLSFTVGSKGLMPYGKLVAERNRLQANLSEIRETNNTLAKHNIMLGSHADDPQNPIPADPEYLIVQARNMGLAFPDETVLHLSNVKPTEKTYIDPGKPEQASRVKGFSDYIIKIVSIISAASLCLALILSDILRYCHHLQEEELTERRERARFA